MSIPHTWINSSGWLVNYKIKVIQIVGHVEPRLEHLGSFWVVFSRDGNPPWQSFHEDVLTSGSMVYDVHNLSDIVCLK